MKVQIAVIILLLVLVSCAPAAETLSPVKSATATPLPTIKAVSTESNPTPTKEPSFFKQQCLKKADYASAEKNPTGALILADYLNNSGKYFVFDLGNKSEEEFMEGHDSLGGLAISPDNKMLYYSDCGNNACKDIISTLQSEIRQFPTSPEWLSSKWLDNQHLIYVRSGDKPDDTVRMFDPFTGADRKISLDLPNPAYFLHPNQKYYLVVNVNKDLSRAVFFDTYERGRIIMWDLQSKKMLVALPYLVPQDPEQAPTIPFFYGWSSDETEFVTTSATRLSDTADEVITEELFTMSQDGKVKQLTHLSDHYKYVRISEPSWSPDGLSIVFWLQVSDDPNQDRDRLSQQMVILNTKTSEITDYCLSHGWPKYSAVDRPIWLPDGEHLVVETRDWGGISETNLVDLQNNSLFLLAHGRTPIGWVLVP